MDTHWSVCYDPARTDLNVQTLKHGYIALTNTEEEYCAWGANDCPEDYGFFTVREVYGLEWLQNCMCEDVSVGACEPYPGGDVYCAVSESACGPGDQYLPALEIIRRNDVQCRLCEPWLDMESITVSQPGTTVKSDPALDNIKLGGGAIAGIVIGSVASVIIITLYILKVSGKKQDQPSENHNHNDGDVPSVS